jgi:hypothetical protein
VCSSSLYHVQHYLKDKPVAPGLDTVRACAYFFLLVVVSQANIVCSSSLAMYCTSSGQAGSTRPGHSVFVCLDRLCRDLKHSRLGHSRGAGALPQGQTCRTWPGHGTFGSRNYNVSKCNRLTDMQGA